MENARNCDNYTNIPQSQTLDVTYTPSLSPNQFDLFHQLFYNTNVRNSFVIVRQLVCFSVCRLTAEVAGIHSLLKRMLNRRYI
jgi:hypothetical protein